MFCFSVPCPRGWLQGINRSCYRFSNNKLGWDSAKSTCESLGSKLAVVNTPDEQQALAPYLAERTWIGLHRDPGDKARWLWVDGSSPNYTNWAEEEPNKARGTENCVEMSPPSLSPAGKWNGSRCNNSLPYVCEISGESMH